MSYRDDHDAALSRIAALEHELAEARSAARASTARDTQIIQMLEREIADLRRGDPDAAAPRRVRPSPAPPPAATSAPPRDLPIDELAQRGPRISPVLVALLIAIAIGAVVVGIVLARDDHRARSRTMGTVDTRPAHAQVFGVAGAREV